MIVTDIIIYFLIFMMGAFFGSFYSLAIYRLPLGKNITHEHSFCPKCKNDLGVLELIPIFSYIFLGGKCKHCKQKISPTYFILEICSGIVFVLLTMSIKMNFLEYDLNKIIILVFSILYISTMFLIAGIDKEKRRIQKSVLVFGLLVTNIYILYLYTVGEANIYRYAIYLLIMLVLVLIDTYLLTKKAESNYTIQILILCMYIVLFSSEEIFVLTVIYTLLALAIHELIQRIINRKKLKVTDKKKKGILPIGFYLCVTNVILIIAINFIRNYKF